MRVPPDAIVEWRCSCGRLVGFLQIVDRVLVATKRQYVREEGEAWSTRTVPRRGIPTPGSDDVTWGSGTCGRHMVELRKSHLRPDRVKRRKVIIQPSSTISTSRRPHRPGDRPSGGPTTFVETW